MEPSTVDLRALMEPSSVAVVGASSTPGKTGYIILKGMMDHGYKGRIYPINPKESEILGLRAFQNVNAISDPVDLVVIAVPFRGVKDVIKDSVENRAKFGLIVTAGFSEIGDLGANEEREITEIARNGGMRLLGPNSIGMVNKSVDLVISIVPFKTWKNGGISVVAQTGIFAGALAANVIDTQNVGLGKSIDIGNRCDLTEQPLLEYFAEDEHTNVVGLHMEGIREGRSLLEASKKVSLKKPIVVLKTGRSEVGAKAAASHTGSLAGDDIVADAAFRQAGLIRANTLQEMIDWLKVFDYQPTPKSGRVGIVTLSGALGVIASDMASNVGMQLAEIEDSTKNEIQKEIMPAWPVRNPADIWVSLGLEPERSHRIALKKMIEDPSVDSLIVLLLALQPARCDMAKVFKEAVDAAPSKPIVAGMMGAKEIEQEWFDALEGIGIPSYKGSDCAERATSAMGALTTYGSILQSKRQS